MSPHLRAMNAHRHTDDLPAFALGALEAEEARLVGGHLAICSRCRAIVKAYHAVVCLLPYAAPPQSPPARLRWRLLASVAADECSDRTQARSMTNEHAGCRDKPVKQPLDDPALASANAVYLAVQGMGCPHCAMRVRKGLLGLEGVMAAEIFLAEGLASLYVLFRKAGVPVELHVYSGIGHGFGFRESNHSPAGAWPQRFEDWVRAQVLVAPAAQ